eukprot:scaffold187707_cov28-Tisochrysis_lutea.AAC.4
MHAWLKVCNGRAITEHDGACHRLGRRRLLPIFLVHVKRCAARAAAAVGQSSGVSAALTGGGGALRSFSTNAQPSISTARLAPRLRQRRK